MKIEIGKFHTLLYKMPFFILWKCKSTLYNKILHYNIKFLILDKDQDQDQNQDDYKDYYYFLFIHLIMI